MKGQQLISAEELCTYYSIDSTFINSLHENGLLTVTTIRKKTFIDTAELRELERLVRLHNDLEINVEGISAIAHLLERMQELREENLLLRNRLSLFED